MKPFRQRPPAGEQVRMEGQDVREGSTVGRLLAQGMLAQQGRALGAARACRWPVNPDLLFSGDKTSVFAEFGIIETLAGTAEVRGKEVNGWKKSFEEGPALEAELSRPHITVSDPNGILYIADKDAHAIRRLSSDGAISTVAGTNEAGFDGDGALSGTSTRLSFPNGLWITASRDLYILDLGNDRVRRLRQGQLETLFVIGGAGEGRGLWVNNSETLAYVAAGKELKVWTPEVGCVVLADGFSSLGNLVVQDDGDLLVTDREGIACIG